MHHPCRVLIIIHIHVSCVFCLYRGVFICRSRVLQKKTSPRLRHRGPSLVMPCLLCPGDFRVGVIQIRSEFRDVLFASEYWYLENRVVTFIHPFPVPKAPCRTGSIHSFVPSSKNRPSIHPSLLSSHLKMCVLFLSASAVRSGWQRLLLFTTLRRELVLEPRQMVVDLAAPRRRGLRAIHAVP